MEPISLNPPAPLTTDPIDLTPKVIGPSPPAPDVARQRAIKGFIGLPGFPQSSDEMEARISNGEEGALRSQAASYVDEQKDIAKQGVITRFVAAKQGLPLTPEEDQSIRELYRQKTAADPRTVFEENYPIQYFENMKQHAQLHPDTPWADLPQEARDNLIYSGRDVMTKQQILGTLLDEQKNIAKQQGWGGWVADRAKEWLIPGYWQLKLRGHLPTSLLGEDLQKDMKEGFQLPTPEFKAWVSSRLQTYTKDNPAMGVEWLSSMMGMSNSDVALNNLLTFTDFLGKPLGAGTAIKGAKATASTLLMRDGIKSALATSFKEPASKAATHEAAGAIKEAATADVAQQVVDVAKQPKNVVREILDNLPGAFNATVDNLKNFPGRLRREAVERIIQDETRAGESIREGAIRIMKVDRIPALEAMEKRATEILDQFAGDYPELKNSILNNTIRHVPEVNGHVVDYYLGKTGTELFPSQKAAKNVINHFKLDAEIEPQGTGFAIRMSAPMRETDYIRDILLSTGETKTPESWLNSLVGKALSPESTLSLAQVKNRKIATYGSSVYREMAHNALEPIRKLRSWSSLPYTDRRKKWLQFQNVIDDMEREPKRFEKPEELDQAYMKSIGRLPDPQEIEAAYAWKRGHEMYETWRDLQAYKNDHRLGAQTITLSLPDPSKETARAMGLKDWSFRGIRLPPKLPGRDDTVMLTGAELGHESFTTIAKLRSSKFGKDIEAKIAKGELKVYKILNHAVEQPLKGLSSQTSEALARYVITDKGRESQLEWKRYGQRPPHYDYDHYVKQAIVKKDPISGRYLYVGDNAISVHNIRLESSNVANALDIIRKMIRDGNIEGAKSFHAGTGLPQTFSEIHNWFKPQAVRGPKGQFQKGVAKLSLEDPIKAIPRDKMLIDLDTELKTRYQDLAGRDGFKDLAHEGSARYLGQQYDPRDVFTLRNTGTASAPIYEKLKPNYINPITSLNRALNRIINSTFMDDYKAFSVEHWIQEALKHDLINATKEEVLASPYFFFHNADSFWKNVAGDNVMRVNNLKTANLQIKQFIGITDPTTSWLHSAAQKLSDSLYSSGSPKIAIATEWMLPKLRDPYTFLRTMTFHSKLGIFNPAQLLVQLNTFATIYGIAGAKYAAPGTKAALLYSWGMKNRHPEIWAKLDELATKRLLPGTSSYKPGELTEAAKLGESSGFFNVANEHAFRDNISRNNIIGNGFQSFLDVGTTPFTMGERGVRYGAWFTAMKEFRDGKPTGPLSKGDLAKVLNRADTLYANMSRASKSTVEHGIFSIPTQFLTYQLRTAELALGKRLTNTERYRLFGTYAAIYGIPGAFGLSGLPVGDYIRKWAIEDGYNVGDNYANTMITEGLPSMLLGLMTGEHYNIQERYGLQGFDPIRSALRGDRTIWDIMTGASGQTLVNMIGNPLSYASSTPNLGAMHGFWKAATSLINRDGEFPFKIEDLVEPFKEVSTVNALWKVYAAMNIGKLVTKSEGIVSDTSPVHSVFQFLSGLQPQALTDNFVKGNIQKDEQAFQKYAEKKFFEDIQRGIVAMQNGDPEQVKDFWKRGRAWLDAAGYPPQEVAKAWSIALQGYESLIEKGNWQWAFGPKKPTTRSDTSIEQYTSQQKQKYGTQ